MDKDVADKIQRVVGHFEALDVVAKNTFGMPSDAATAALLGAIRSLTNQAVLSAWRYADEQTKAQ